MNEQVYNDEMLINSISLMFDMKITTQDMKQLKPDFVQKVYIHFIRDFGASLEQINQLPFDVMESVRQHPDMYRSVIRTMALAKVIGMFLKNISNDDSFMPADLYDPKPRRTRRFFSQLVEFYYAANDFTEQLNAIEEQVSIKREAREQMEKNVEKNAAKLRQLKMENAENQIREDQELGRIAEVKEDIQKCLDTKLNLKSQLDELKMVVATLATKIKDVELEIIEGNERIEKLTGQVVQASERQEIEERERKLAIYKNDNENRSKRLADLKQSMQAFVKAFDLVKDELMPVLQEIEQGINKQKECMSTFSQGERSKGVLLEEAEDIALKSQHLKELLASKQERLSQMHHSWNLKKESRQEELKQHKLMLEEIRRSQTEEEIVIQDMEVEKMQTLQEIDQLKEQLMNFDHFIATNYQKILSAMETHNNELQATLTDLMERINQHKK